MNRIQKPPPPPLKGIHPHLRRLDRLYAAMDRAYSEAAARHGFRCTGCENNCCRTRFYHYTVLEYLYLYEGYRRLPPRIRNEVQRRAAAYHRGLKAADAAESAFNAFCPLNTRGACLLYGRRPMICRLHGIPYTLHTPGRPALRGPGCPDFVQTCGDSLEAFFDRTPFYQEMAAREQSLRKGLGIRSGIKMTVAAMLLDFEPLRQDVFPLAAAEQQG